MKTYIRIYVPLLLTTLACAFVQNMIFPPSPTPAVTPSPERKITTATPFPATPTPSPEPILNPAPIHCSNDLCLNACLSRLEKVLETKPFAPIGNDIYEEQGAKFNLVIYQVNGDQITDPVNLYVPSEYRKYQEDTEAHLRIWNFYIAVIPPELRTTIKEFIIFTDGPDETMAWVNSPDGINYSQVGFDLLDSGYPPYLADTLIHETAHLLTLNTSQVPYDKDHFYYYDERKKTFFDCKQYVSGGDCSLPKSYINLFYQKFWKDNYAEWWEVSQKAEDAKDPDEYWGILDQYYNEHSDWFLDSYAASSIEEDMAESFSFFVLNPKPSVHAVFVKKILFFYDFPELVEYRRQMIEGLCSYVNQ